MTDVTLPAEIDGAIDNLQMAHALSKSGGHSGYVVSGVDLSALESSIDTNGVNSFSRASDSGLNFTINGGEAFCYGWFCRDRQTTITLPASTTSTVCVGYDPDEILGAEEAPSDNENIIVDIESNFTDRQPYLPLYEVTTNSSAVSDYDNVRNIGPENAPSNTFATKDMQNDYESFRDAGGSVGGTITIQDGSALGASVVSRFTTTGQTSDLSTSGEVINRYAFTYPNAVETIGGLELVNYNGSGTGWYATGERFLAGLRLTTHNGSAGKVEAAEIQPDGDTVFVGSLTSAEAIAPRHVLTGAPTRIYYDTEKDGDEVHFQRAASATETSLTLSGTNVGINDPTPSVPLDVGGRIRQQGRDVVDSGSGQYRIEVDGSDGQGIINFKTQ